MLLLSGVFPAATAAAESRMALACGYSLSTTEIEGELPVGWLVSVLVTPVHANRLSITSEVAGEYGEHQHRSIMFVNGLRFTANASKYMSVFVEGLAGVQHDTGLQSATGNINRFAVQGSFGTDFQLAAYVAARFQFTARHTFDDPSVSAYRFMTGIVFGATRVQEKPAPARPGGQQQEPRR